MNFKTKIQKIMIAFFFIFSSIIFAAEPTSINKADDTTYSDDKPNIVVNPHRAEFTIKLKSNPTTGYSWFLREYSHRLIVPLKHSYQRGSTKLIGAPGYEFWTFRMKPEAFIVPQQMIMRFVYARPWQGADNSTQIVFRISTTAK